MELTKNIFSQENKKTLKWIAAGVAIFGVAYLGRQLFLRFTKNNEKTTQIQSPKKKTEMSQKKTPERLNTKMTEYSQYYFDKDKELQMIQSCISENPTVEEIYLNSPLIARDEFIKYTREMRKRRRLIRKTNEDQYINTILTYQSEIQELLFRSRMQLIEALQMDSQVFSQMQQNYEAIEELPALNRKALSILKKKLVTQTKEKKMSTQKLKQIINEQINFMKNKMYIRIRQKLQNEMSVRQDQILVIVQTLLEDIIYEKFGYEQEDFQRKIREVGFDISELLTTREKMRSDIAEFNYDSIESLADPESVHEEGDYSNLDKSARTLPKSQQQFSSQGQ